MTDPAILQHMKQVNESIHDLRESVTLLREMIQSVEEFARGLHNRTLRLEQEYDRILGASREVEKGRNRDREEGPGVGPPSE